MDVLNAVKLKDVWSKENIMAGCGGMRKKAMGGKIKMKAGGSTFPDLNKDGKVTQADILKGRGVGEEEKMKKGGKVKKKAPKGMHYMPDGKLMKDSDHKKKKTKKKMAYGGGVKKMKNGGKIDGCAMRGKTRGRNV
jgi:hypothetical protein